MYYTEESLETLKHSIDIVSVLGEYVHLKRSGADYKACCPFHDEKTPSFIVYPTRGHYHCYGCGEHGDAINFLMKQQGYSFSEAVLFLAKKFHVDLVIKTKTKESSGQDSKECLRRINKEAERFFQYCLLCLPEGGEALSYLYKRGFSLDTIDRFQIGYAPEQRVFVRAMEERGISVKQLEWAGYLSKDWFLFAQRIMFPIQDSLGYTIGFSSRRFKEGGKGGKYINSPETLLFKKSRVLYGLQFSRKRIAKEKRVILVEGQADCLQMIDFGFNCTLAAQGTSFTETHVKELVKLGVSKAYLLFDGDAAGEKASLRVGDLCQVAGIAVIVCRLPSGQDPDSFLMQRGPEELRELLDRGEDYLSFLVWHKIRSYEQFTPREKARVVEEVIQQVQHWGSPIMIHEYLRQLASLVKVPEAAVLSYLSSIKSATEDKGKKADAKEVCPDPEATAVAYKGGKASKKISPRMILEADVIRCLLFAKPEEEFVPATVRHYLSPEEFHCIEYRSIFVMAMNHYNEKHMLPSMDDMMALVWGTEAMTLLVDRRINTELMRDIVVQAIQKLLDKHWRDRKRNFCHQMGKELDSLQEYVRLSEERIKVSLVS
ncbi:DNA primase [Chlamydia muridarum str. Nigg]|jgi:DNA primase, catalytic core|uniref:DNA primase n=2 Tax=Chlamydia muridarum TaxID=83560 RepID=DNAG_CHLMU|nr:DNA primase [Chlamydia muridarum]Q9PLC9.1 RecName: Full=DNA primase [Chlamydia muridarum str. Nigg]UFX34461.1 DNA primase [Chlamydia trachomatis]AAF39049.1 DNA primase [Chlamydia muridarum str. Nigg]AHH22568.1 DNA primase [Chlamydia muridarum str. Nigg3 CMUT3-5]AHH23492.1 DNA primase [Chlamydia muridarum str. Nigg CM972]AID37715.1 DNA primase [Chlamydia muridarum str. Nigg 2 MCR]